MGSLQPKLQYLEQFLPPWPENHKLIVLEYQKHYQGVQKFSNDWLKSTIQQAHQESAKTENIDQIPETRPLTDAQVAKEIASNHLPAWKENFQYRMLTFFSRFRHVRLLILQKNSTSGLYEGFAYGFTEGDALHGVLKEKGEVWTYDNASEYEPEGFTELNAQEVLDAGKLI